MEALYISRKSSGGQRAIFGDHVFKQPGLYNKAGSFNITLNEVDKYDFLNLTAQTRADAF